MIIIIDGYNFLKAIALQADLSDQFIKYWINRFNDYMNLRGNKVIIVFDAGPSFFSSVEHHGNVEVVYAGQHQTADDALKAWLQKRQGADMLLVTSDREIRNFAENCAIVSISSQDFYKIFQEVMGVQEDRQVRIKSTIHKTSSDSHDADLDDLMEFATRQLVQEDLKNEYTIQSRVRDGKKASRADKNLMKKVNKI